MGVEGAGSWTGTRQACGKNWQGSGTPPVCQGFYKDWSRHLCCTDPHTFFSSLFSSFLPWGSREVFLTVERELRMSPARLRIQLLGSC